MNSLNERSRLSRHWSNLRSRLRDDPDLLEKSALILFVTGAAVIAVALAFGR
jgi:hypothetical protein